MKNYSNQNIKIGLAVNRTGIMVSTIFLATILFSSCESFLSQTSTNDVANSDMFTDAASLESARICIILCKINIITVAFIR